MPRPKKVTDAEILQIAREEFEVSGFDVTMEVIARRLGVSATVLYRRFANKDELFIAAVLPAGVHSSWPTVALHENMTPEDVTERLTELARRIVLHFEQTLPAFLQAAINRVDAELVVERLSLPNPRASIEALAGWLRRAHELKLLSCPDPNSAAATLMGALLFQQLHAMSPFLRRDLLDTADFPARTVRVLLEGLAQLPERRTDSERRPGPERRNKRRS